jgi:low temperature requirement protein LtrA
VVLFWLIWWSWTQFTWTLNPADTGHALVRATTLVATATAFVMAASVPRAYEEDPLWFAVPYLVVRLLGLGLQLRVDLERREDVHHQAVWRWAVSSTVVLAVVLAGAFVDPPARTWIWLLAIVGDLVAVTLAGRGHAWDIDPSHFTERHGLFVIIALGESLIVAGTAVAGEERTLELVTAASAVLVVACLLWWTYFGWLKDALEEGLGSAPATALGQLARDAYSLGHFALVCGIVGFAVAAEEIVHHPAEHLHDEVVAALGVGIALFVGASAYAHRRLVGRLLVPRLAILAVTIPAMVVVSDRSPAWPLGAVALGLLAVVLVEAVRHQPAGGGGPAGHTGALDTDVAAPAAVAGHGRP